MMKCRFITYYVLEKYAFDEDLRKVYKEVAREHWEMERPEKDGLWEMLTYAVSGDIDKESLMFFLKEFNVDLDRYSTKNSQRKDLEFLF